MADRHDFGTIFGGYGSVVDECKNCGLTVVDSSWLYRVMQYVWPSRFGRPSHPTNGENA